MSKDKKSDIQELALKFRIFKQLIAVGSFYSGDFPFHFFRRYRG